MTTETTRCVQRIFAGHLDCRTRFGPDSAILEPFDETSAAKRVFRTVVKEVIESDGDGYAIQKLASSTPSGPVSSIWIIRDDNDLLDDGNDELDRIIEQVVTLDLSNAGKVHRRKTRPVRHRRQKLVRFAGRAGDLEHFSLRQPIPWVGCNWPTPPTPLQSASVERIFSHTPITYRQAGTMLSAFEYATEVARAFPFTAPRRAVITAGVAAFILTDQKLRDSVRRWTTTCWDEESHIAAGIVNHRPYKKAIKFAERLIDDMRGSGADIFG